VKERALRNLDKIARRFDLFMKTRMVTAAMMCNVSSLVWPFVDSVLNATDISEVYLTDEYRSLCLLHECKTVAILDETCVWPRGRSNASGSFHDHRFNPEIGAYSFESLGEMFDVLTSMYQDAAETFPSNYAFEMKRMDAFVRKLRSVLIETGSTNSIETEVSTFLMRNI
jgi:hypothetical protein